MGIIREEVAEDLSPLVKSASKLNPVQFGIPNPTIASQCLSLLKDIFDYRKKNEVSQELGPLPSLPVEGLDEDQIWQALAIHNEPTIKWAKRKLDKLESVPLPKAKHGKQSESDDGSDDFDGADDFDGLSNDDYEGSENDQENMDGSGSDTQEENDDDDGAENDHGNDSDDSAVDVDDLFPNKDSKRRAKKSGDDDDVTVKRRGPSEVDDKFFKLEDMEKFVEDQENMDFMDEQYGDDDGDDNDDDDDELAALEDEDEEGLGLEGLGALRRDGGGHDDDDEDDFGEGFGDEDDDENDDDDDGDDKGLRYQDFFDAPDGEDENDKGKGKQKKRNILDSDGEDEDMSGEELSKFERQQMNAEKKIKDLEEQRMKEKAWTLKGEVSSRQRPVNSLLETVVDFDFAAKLPPTITQEHTISLEDLIKKRVQDLQFDDVEPKVQQAPGGRVKPKTEVSGEKSKVSLAEIYAQDFVKLQTAGENLDDALIKQRTVAIGVFKAVCNSLDALSNFHYTPKVVTEEPAVRVKTPAISMEEALPVAMSDAQTLAPHEMYEPKGQAPVGETELGHDEKRRARNASKERHRKEKKQKEIEQKAVIKANPGMGNKYAKKKALEELAKASKAQSKGKGGNIVTTDATKNLLKKDQSFKKQRKEKKEKQSKKD